MSELPQLEAGQQNPDVHIRGSAPGIRTSQPQVFLLNVDADTKEGFFRRTRKAVTRPFALKVWPDHGYDVKIDKTNDFIARVHIDLWPGLASTLGLRGQFTFNSVVPIGAKGIVPHSGTVLDGSPILDTSSSGTLGKVLLQTGTLQAFHGYPYEVSLVFQRPLTKEEWDLLQSSIKVAFE
jgi:hypothetical protein